MTKMKRGLALVLAAVLAMSAAGCSQTDSSDPAESGASGAAEQGESQGEAQGNESSGDEDYIIIGSVNDLSGNRSVNGNAINNGVKLAVDEINAAGGVLGRQLKLITYDNKNDSQESINAYTRLADLDKACAVITSDASSVCLSLVEISNQKKVPLMGMPSDPRAVMNPDTGEVYPYMFLVDQPNAPQQANIMAKYIEANTDLRKAAVFYDQSNAYTVTNSEAFIDIWSEIGEVVIVETCNANDQDYRTQLNKIKNSGAEFIYLHRFMTDLNHFYLEHPAFFEKDYDGDGFRWLDCHAEEQCIYAFERAGKKERIAAVFNFSGIEQADYTLEIPDAAGLRRLFTSERRGYGGSVSEAEKVLKPDEGVFEFTLAPFSAEYYLIEEDD